MIWLCLTLSDACDGMLSYDNVADAGRASLGFSPSDLFDSRERRQDVRHRDSGRPSRSAAPMPFLFFPGFPCPSLAAAGRGSAGFDLPSSLIFKNTF